MGKSSFRPVPRQASTPRFTSLRDCLDGKRPWKLRATWNTIHGMKLDEVQQAAQEQFARRSHRYGRGHILENVEDVRAAIELLQLAPGSRVLDVATGAGHTGLFLASLGHEVTLTDIAAPVLERAKEAAKRRGLKAQTRQPPAEQFPYAGARFGLPT